jgi:hypothetical protein
MMHLGLIQAMSRPDFYPHHPKNIEVLQTHISFIFLADQYVYKVKKAVDFGFLDFTTLQKREFYCREELRLNRRLAPEAYIDVLPISLNTQGHLVLGKAGQVVEYAVLMKRLPRDKMLKNLLASGQFAEDAMDSIAQKVAAFHREAETGGRIDEIGGYQTVCFNHEENFEQTLPYVGFTITLRQFLFICDYARQFLSFHEDLFRQRVKNHKIRDCHGDLHIEHIVVDNGITIFDCIEFNERLRYGDVAAEVAFLAMDLDFNTYPNHAAKFISSYIQYAADPDVTRLLNFYKCYYAYVRGKVTGFRTRDKSIPDLKHREAAITAAHYFDLAYGYAARIEKPALIIMSGLMGTGKSLLARKLSTKLGAAIIRMDALRKEMLGIAPTDKHLEAFGNGIYADDISRKTYGEALKRAVSLLKSGVSIIIDASFKKQLERFKAANAAKAAGADFFVIECRCPDRIIEKRLRARAGNLREPSDGRLGIFLEQKNDYESITEFPPDMHIVINTDSDPEDSRDEALRFIRRIAKNA